MSTTCLGCGVDVEGRRRKVFCNNACQQSHRRRLLLEAWLETGVCGRTSYQGHYVRDYLYAQQGGCCAICGIEDRWNGVTLALIVDHVKETQPITVVRICGSSVPTVTASCRRIRRGIVVAVATTGDSGTPTASPTDAAAVGASD